MNKNGNAVAWLTVDAPVTKQQDEIRTIIWRVYLGTSTRRSAFLDIRGGTVQATPSAVSNVWLSRVLKYITGHLGAGNLTGFQIHEIGIGATDTTPDPNNHNTASMGPQLYSCGNAISWAMAMFPAEASMGPQLYSCGNTDQPNTPNLSLIHI